MGLRRDYFPTRARMPLAQVEGNILPHTGCRFRLRPLRASRGRPRRSCSCNTLTPLQPCQNARDYTAYTKQLRGDSSMTRWRIFCKPRLVKPRPHPVRSLHKKSKHFLPDAFLGGNLESGVDRDSVGKPGIHEHVQSPLTHALSAKSANTDSIRI